MNFTPQTNDEWKTVLTEYSKIENSGKRMWFETIIPGFDEAFFVIAQPPTAIPQPEIGQNELLVIEMNLTIEDYRGMEEKVAFATGASSYSARSIDSKDTATEDDVY